VAGKEDKMVGDQAVREAQISREMSAAFNALDFLEQKLDALSKKTEDICMSKPSEASETQKEPNLCKLAGRIKMIRDKIDSASGRLSLIIDEIEL